MPTTRVSFRLPLSPVLFPGLTRLQLLLEGIGLSIRYYTGTYTSVTQLSDLTPLSEAPSQAGAYTLLADFPGSTDYKSGVALDDFTLAKTVPQITWSPPASIIYGTPLGSDQLDPSANIPGTFTYTPARRHPGCRQRPDANSSIHAQDTTDYYVARQPRRSTCQGHPQHRHRRAGWQLQRQPVFGLCGDRRLGRLRDSCQQPARRRPHADLLHRRRNLGKSLGPTPPTDPGTYTVVAIFPGIADYNATRSAPVMYDRQGNPRRRGGVVMSSVVYGQPVTFTAAVTAPDTPSGTFVY